MLTQQDLDKIEGVVERVVDKKLDQKLDSKFLVFEKSLLEKIHVLVDEKIEKLVTMIARSFQDVQNQLALKVDKTDIERIEERLFRLDHKVYMNHEVRIETLENKANLT